MMRSFVFAIACLFALPFAPGAAAQTAPEVVRANRALSAIWRPLSGPATVASLQAACAGAVEEMEAVEASLPPVLTAASLSRVRALHGLLIVPTGDDPASAYFFPSAMTPWFASGVGAISVINETEGFLAVRDAQGHDIAVQLGNAGGRPMMRLRAPGSNAIVTYVGCAATTVRS
jgi:hypothetical protein